MSSRSASVTNSMGPSLTADQDDAPVSGYGRIQIEHGRRGIQSSRGDGVERDSEREPKRRRVRQALFDALPDPDVPVPDAWTPGHVGIRLIDAFRILDRLPQIAGPRGSGTGWPAIMRSAEDLKGWGQDDQLEALLRSAAKPSRAEIDRMEATMRWLDHLRNHDTGLALQLMYWAAWLARKRRLRDLCVEKRWAYSTFQLRVNASKKWIAAKLVERGDAVF